MTKQELADQANASYDSLAKAQQNAFQASEKVKVAKDSLSSKVNKILRENEPKALGSNAESRQATIDSMTEKELSVLADAEKAYRKASHELTLAQSECSRVQTLLGIYVGINGQTWGGNTG